MPNPPDPAPLFELFNEIGIIEQLSRTRLEQALPDGLIAPHFAVLNRLIRVQDGATPQDMARAFQIPKTSLSHTLKVLEAKGLIDTRTHPEDRRSKQVWITAAGRELRDQTILRLAPSFADVLGKLDMEGLLAIRPVLTELRKVLDAARNPN